MSLPTRNNPYSFDEFLKARDSFDYYADDEFFRKVVKHFSKDRFEEVDREVRKVSKLASDKWKKIAEKIARPEEQPYIMHYDAHNHRIDRIVRPEDTMIMERDIFGEKMFADGVSPWTKLSKMSVIYQNGESSVCCPMTCTEGMIEIIKRYADTPELQNILKHTQEGIDGEIAIGAQYISEIQGGSDIPNNVIEAVNGEDGQWHLYGTKFFCSATHADYSMVTAKPVGSEEVGLFVIPSWMPGNKEKEIRNGYTIDRIKVKIGTRELTTAEITFNGAIAYQVGPLNRGVANIVGVVLTHSRLTVGIGASSYMRRAVREARQYAGLREAFDEKISSFALVEGQLRWMEYISDRTLAGAYKMYDDFIGLSSGLKGGLTTEGELETKQKSFRVRELVMWQKMVASIDSTNVVRLAMSIFGGHGAMEDFSALPRLYRDSCVNELWEGPVNVLMEQIYRDFGRAVKWYPIEKFIRDCLGDIGEAKIQAYTKEMTELLSHGTLTGTDDKTIEVANRWYRFVVDLYHDYQDMALKEVEPSRKPCAINYLA